jgi:hypothetical protein
MTITEEDQAALTMSDQTGDSEYPKEWPDRWQIGHAWPSRSEGYP